MKNVYNTLKFKHIGFLRITLLLLVLIGSGVKGWGQVSYLGLDGGLEGSATIDNTTAQTAPAAGVWRKANATQTIANETSTVRSGTNSLRANNSSTTGRRVWSPNSTISSTTSQVTIQFYKYVASVTNSQEEQRGIINNTEALSGTYNTPANVAGTWVKVTYTKASSTFTTISGLFLHRQIGTGGDMFVDDMAVYTGALDNTAPSAATAAATASPTASTLDVSWTAAAGGVDGGGYIVVRGTTDPTTAPNVNGIYAVNNLVAAGMTVVYRGTGTSFTDGSLTSGTQYFYRIYTYDKAYNYSASSNCNGTTTSSCSAPSTQASALSTSTPTTDGFSASWTAGNGNGTMLVVRPTAQTILAPTSGTSYAANTAWASAGQINTNNRVFFRAAGTSMGPLTGLTAGTQYTATAYEYNTSGDCYNITSPVSSSIYTLSTEPTSHAATFTCNASAYNQIDLTFAAASTTSGNGYLILQKTGSAPTGTPTDATAYIVGATLGDGTIAAIINSSSATTQAITGLTGNTNYHYAIIPFNWDGTNASTYNYRVAATAPTSNCTTLVQPSNLSDIIFNAGSPASTNLDIPYITYQSVTISNTGTGAGGSIGVMGFTVRDGGAAGTDGDNLPSILTGISFNVTNFANIRSAALFNGNTFIATVSVSGVSPIVFSGLSGVNVTCADNSTLALNLRVTFITAVTDNQKMVFTVASATAATGSTSSLFAAANAGGAVSENTGGNINRIEVTADRLTFLQGPSGATNGVAMTPAITVRSVDVNNNLDLDNTSAITLTCSTPAALTSGSTATAALGLSTFSSVIHGIDGTYTMVASAVGLTSTINSSSYIISSVLNGTWRTASGSPTALWASTAANSTVTWERMTSGSWVLQTLPVQPPTSGNANTVIIRHEVTLQGTNTHKDIIIASGGILNTSTVAATFGSLLVQTGGIFNRQGSVTFDVSGTLEVEDGATFTFKQTNQNSRTSGIWAGTEKFHKNSNFEVVFSDNVTLTILESANDVSLFTDGGSTACFGNIIINCSSGVMQMIPIGFGTPGSPKQLTHQDLIFRANSDPKFAEGAFNAIIGRDLIIENTYNQTISLATTAVTAAMTVLGNFTNNSTRIFRMLNNAGGNITLNVNGDINVNSTGSIDFNFANGGVSVINLKGDLSVATGALIFSTATTVANNTFNFTGTGDGLTAGTTQTLSIASTGATRNQYINFNIATGAYVQLSNQNFELGINSTVAVAGSGGATGGTLDFNFNGTTALNITSVSSGSRFGLGGLTGTLSGGRLKISSPNGISSTSGTSGNVQVTNAPDYNSVSTFHYVGKVDQLTGTGLPTASSGKIVIVELLDNTKTLSLTSSTGISNNTTLDALGGKLEIKKGIVIGTTSADFNGGGRLVMTDGEYRISTITATPLTNLLPQLSNYSNYAVTGGIVHLNGSNAIQILSGTPSYYNLSFSGTNVLATNYKGISNGTSVSNAINIFGDAIVDVKSFALGGLTSSFTMANNSRYITDGGSTKPDAGGTYSLGSNTTIDFACTSGAGIVRLGTTPINYANVIVSGTDVSNTSTSTGIQFQSGGTFLVKNGATFNLANTAGFGGTTATSISSLNSPAITLESGSTINYNGVAQTITNTTLTSPTTSNYYNLTISGSGNKTAPSGNLVVAGNITGLNTAAYAHNSGTVIANGSAGQTYSATIPFSMYKLSNSSTSAGGGLTINSNLIIENEIALASLSKINLNTGDVVIKSDVNATAALAAVPNEAGIISYTGAGRFNIQRYLPGVKAWRLLATPVVVGAASPTITDSWREGGTGLSSTGFGTRLTGPGSSFGIGAKLDEYSIRASMKSYNMGSNNFTDITESDLITGKKIANDDGYYIFVRGDRGVDVTGTGTPTVLQIKGQVRTGNQIFGVDPSKFRSIGNPFPSRLDMRDVYLGGIKLQSFYVWNPAGAGNYNAGQYVGYTFTGTNFTNGAAVLNYIESGQAFFVQNNDAGALSLVIKETDKTTGSANVSRGSATSPTLEINLKTTNVNGTEILADGTMLNFDNTYNNGIDNYDVKKITNSFDNVAIKSNGTSLLVERKTTLVVTDSIHLNISNMRTANFKFEIDPSLLVHPELTAYLKDRFLQTETEVSLTSITNINFATTADAASKAANRFVIVFRPSGVLPVTFVDIAAIKNANKTHTVKWAVANELNIQQYDVERSSNGSNFVSIGSTVANQQSDYNFDDAAPLAAINFYRVKATSQSGQVQYSAIVKLTADAKDASIALNTNPVNNGQVVLGFYNQQAGQYGVAIYNNVGQLVKSEKVNINGNAFLKTINMGNNFKGNGNIVITNLDGVKKTIPFVSY